MTALAWGAKVSPEFREKARNIAAAIGTEPSSLMACIAFETGKTFSPKARNPGSSATGLIQFMRDTARGLGTTVEALAEMTAEEQLAFVYDYLRPFSGRVATLGDLYMSILYPPAVGKPDDFAVFESASKAYQANAGLDFNHDGVITKRECVSIVEKLLAEGLQVGNRAFEEQPDVPTIALNEVTPSGGRAPEQEQPKEKSMPLPLIAIATAITTWGPTIASLIPQVAALFDRDKQTPARLEAAQAVVAKIVETTGAVNTEAAMAAISNSPETLAKVREAVVTAPEILPYLIVEVGGGFEAARKVAADPTSLPFWKQAPFYFGSALLGLAAMVVGHVLWGVGWNPSDRSQVLILAVGMINLVGGFYLGGSIGSARKTDIMAQQQQNASK